MEHEKRWLLVTGASTGIGATCVEHAVRQGFGVWAGVRKESDGEALRSKLGSSVEPIRLDVTVADEIAAAKRTIAARTGLYGLVNNAGVAVAGPLEILPIEDLRNQLEINVIGLVAVTQAMIPMLRTSRGRIVNIGSIAGRASAPVSGPYSASKFAVEALTDALRMELKPWGIEVSVVEPGAIKTPIWEKSIRGAEEGSRRVAAEEVAKYERLVAGLKARAEKSAAGAIPASRVADAVMHALTSKRPKTRYVVGTDARIRLVMRRLPDRWQDWIILKALGM